MYKFFIPVVVALSISVAAYAETLQLAFLTLDGTEHAFNARNLKMKISDGNLSVANDDESQVFSLETLNKMYFKGGESTSIGEFEFYKEGELKAYSLSGEYKGTFATFKEAEKKLDKGVYVFRIEGKSIKVIVK